MIDKQIDFDTPLAVDAPKDFRSWFKGFLYACELFGIWRDGKQYLGIGRWSVDEVRKEIERFVREQQEGEG